MGYQFCLQVDSYSEGLGAHKAGILKGDILFSYNDTRLTSGDDLSRAISECTGSATVELFRNNQPLSLVVPAGRLGIVVNQVTFDPEQHFLEKKIEEAIAGMIVTTAPHIEGYKVSKTLDIVTAECVFGMNILSDFLTSITDVFGGRSETAQQTLREARKSCLKELKREAAKIGATAIIAVDLDYSEFTGQGKSMLFLVASGTAVIASPTAECCQ